MKKSHKKKRNNLREKLHIYCISSVARWHLWKILEIFQIVILENLDFLKMTIRVCNGVHYIISSALCSIHLVKIFIFWVDEYNRYQYGNTRMEYGIVRIINLTGPLQERLLEDSKLKALKKQRPKDGRLDQRISQSNSNTTALHSVWIIKHKNRNIEFFGNCIIIFIIDYFMEFSLF